jgi:cysteine synthase A
MGIGLAQACAYLGLRFVCVVDPKTTQQNIDILKAYGAEVDMVTRPDPATKEYLPVRLERVRELLGRDPNNFWPAQYSNPDNPAAHYSTMREVEAALGGPLDYVFCATSTCGTLRGCAEYVREHKRQTRVYAVDAVGSAIFGSEKARRLIPGHGAAVIPELFQTDLTDHVVHVTDLDCVAGCRRLVRREGILAGGSSGGVLRAVELSKDAIAPGSTCVAILADRGERYLDTIYSDTWVEANFGHVSHLWTQTSEA